MKVLVCGDLILDEYIVGDAKRISPEAPVPVIRQYQVEYRLGGAANIAHHLRELGIPDVSLMGVIGEDIEGDVLRSLTEAAGIRLISVCDGRPTTVKRRVIAQNQHVCRIDREVITQIEYPEIILKPYDVIYIVDYAKGAVTRELLDATRQSSATFKVAAPKPPIMRFSGFDLLTMNEKEFSTFGHELSIPTAEGLNAKTLVVTRGKDGVSVASPKEDLETTFTAQAFEVIDVTGAGDTLSAVLVYCLIKGMPLARALNIANIAAGESCQHVGCWVCDADFISRMEEQ